MHFMMSNPLLDIYSRIYREHTNFIMMLSAFYGTRHLLVSSFDAGVDRYTTGIHVAVYMAAVSTLA